MVIRAASAADAAQIAAVMRESWLAAYDGLIEAALIDRATSPDGGARIRQSFRIRPWQHMIAALADQAPNPPEASGAPGNGLVEQSANAQSPLGTATPGAFCDDRRVSVDFPVSSVTGRW